MTMQARNRQRKCYWFRLDIFLSWPGGSGARRFPVMALWHWGTAFSCHGLVAVGHGVFLSWPGGSGAWRFPVMALWQWGMAFSCHGLVAVGHGVFLPWPGGSGAWTKYLNRNRSDNASWPEKFKKCKHIQALFGCSINSNVKQGCWVFVFCFCFVFRF